MTFIKRLRMHWSPTCHLAGLALVAFLLLGGGCTLLKPVQSTSRYYILTPTRPIRAMAGQRNEHTAGYRVQIEPIEMADYLNAKEMVVRTGTNEVLFAVFHQWAEPLDDGIRRVLAEDLQACPGVHEVLTDQTPKGSVPAFTVSIRVVACQGVRLPAQNSVEFVAVWHLADRDRILQRGVFRLKPTAWNGRDYGELAQRLSRAIGDLAEVLAEALSPAGNSLSP
jgi:uncharacterized lipoprotein YmbA